MKPRKLRTRTRSGCRTVFTGKFRFSLNRCRTAEDMPFQIRFVSIRQVEFPSAIEADPVRPFLDREDATQVTVMASKRKLENPKQRVHRF